MWNVQWKDVDVFKFTKYQIYHVSEQELRNTFNYLRILERC